MIKKKVNWTTETFIQKLMSLFGDDYRYDKTIEYDNIKKKKRINNGVHLIYFTNIRKHVDNIETFNNETILKKIYSYG